MRTCGQIIQRALVKIGAIDAGRAATSDEADSAFGVLKSLYTNTITSGLLGKAIPVRASSAYTACERHWITVDSADEFTITIPGGYEVCCAPSFDGWTCCADNFNIERAPKDLTFIVVTDGTETVSFLYDAYDGRWTAIEPLELTDDAPFSGRDAEGLSCLLALHLADEYSAQAGPMTARTAQSFKAQLGRRDVSPAETVAHQYF